MQRVLHFTPADLARFERDLGLPTMKRITFFKWKYEAEAAGWDAPTASRLAFARALVRSGQLRED
jgi:hypothetical protein